ncbi:response regulator [Thalassolituus marinus]|uniref:Response regulator n=1 Tax=Thalassolituus marinus TaxID=671053 RepID=A0ABS7ZQD7_9GAMM|nr:response regulator [Thalassolituus marinus]MCA6063936.1 response regulator [Thalassolituus marinus]
MTIRNALVVDDSKSARMMLQRLLSKMNVQAETVDSAEEALSFLESRQPDVIFMDHMMPGMDGLAATQLIKSNPRTAGIPTIMYTSKEGDEYQDMARSHGAEGVLAKPASHEAVMAVIEALDEPAANDDSSATPAAIPLVEIDRLVQKHLKAAIAEAKAEISAGLDTTTQQLQAMQAQQIDIAQARIYQQFDRWKNEFEKSQSDEALFQKTRTLNQRLAITVADRMVKKNADDLVTVMKTNRTTLESSIASVKSDLQKQQAIALKQAVIGAAAIGTVLGGAIGVLAAFML